jgi:hypothetical protein
MKTVERTIYTDPKNKKGEVSYLLQVPENAEELKEICQISDPYHYIEYKLTKKVDSGMRRAFKGGKQFNPATRKYDKKKKLDAADSEAVAATVRKYSRLPIGRKKKANGDELTEEQLLQQMRKRLIRKGIDPTAADEFVSQYREVTEAPPSED